jgi:hypothetical protein
MHDQSQLVGTWRMLTWNREFADTGERADALGADPVGFVSYGADGRFLSSLTLSGLQAARRHPWAGEHVV